MESPRKKQKKSLVFALDVAEFLLFLQAQHLSENPSVDDFQPLPLEKSLPEPIDHLKLESLLYYVQGFNVAIYGQKAFEEEIHRWSWGPVVPNVWKEYKHFGKKPIDNPGSETIFDPQLKQLVEVVWKIFSNSTGNQLAEETRNEDPWMETERNFPISLESFRKEFTKLHHLHNFLQASCPNQEAKVALIRSLRKEIRRSFINGRTLEQVEKSFGDSLALLGKDKGEAFYPIEFEQDDTPEYVCTLQRVQWSLVGAAKYEHPRGLYHLSRLFSTASLGMPTELEEKFWTATEVLEKRALDLADNDPVLRLWLEDDRQKLKELVQEIKDCESEEFILLGIALCGTKFAEKFNVDDKPKVQLELIMRNRKFFKKKGEESLAVAEKYSSALGFHEAGYYFQESDPPDLDRAFSCYQKASSLGHGESSCSVIRFLLWGKVPSADPLGEAEELANKMKEENGDLNGFITIAQVFKAKQKDDYPYRVKAGRPDTFQEDSKFISMLDSLPASLTSE